MFYQQKIEAAIFDMDGLLIDSEPLWTRAELDVFTTLGLDANYFLKKIPDTRGLRIDQVVQIWFTMLPDLKAEQPQVVKQIIERVLILIEEQRPILPGVKTALQLCQQLNLKIALASASPMLMIQHVLDIFSLRHYFTHIVSAETLAYSKPHPQIYLDAANLLNINPLNCVTLEDSIYGMIATKAARMRSIVVPAIEEYNDTRWSLAEVKRMSLIEITTKDLCG